MPSTMSQVENIIGFASFYKSLIPGFWKLVSKMSAYRRLLRAKKPVIWTEERTEENLSLKKILLSHPVRSVPDYNAELALFEVYSDFSALDLCNGSQV